MSTDAQNAANLANAQLSTGPRTEAGKAISSRNSLKHGLTAKTVLLPGEDPAGYQILRDGMFHDLDPLNTLEAALAAELVDLQWRLQRVSNLEARILSANPPDFKALNTISLHASRMKRQYSATLKDLERSQQASSKLRNTRLEEAEMVHQADQILQRPSTLDTFGFDFTLADLESWLGRKAALKAADQAIVEYNCPFDDDDESAGDEDSFERQLRRAA